MWMRACSRAGRAPAAPTTPTGSGPVPAWLAPPVNKRSRARGARLRDGACGFRDGEMETMATGHMVLLGSFGAPRTTRTCWW